MYVLVRVFSSFNYFLFCSIIFVICCDVIEKTQLVKPVIRASVWAKIEQFATIEELSHTAALYHRVRA